MLYIRNLDITDENDETVFRVKHIRADKGLKQAISFLDSKEGKKAVKNVFYKFLFDLDNEFKEYFSLK